MTIGVNYSDQQLTAFLDGEMELDEAGKLTEAIERDADLADRLEALRIDTDQIAKSFDGLLTCAPSVPEFLDEQRVERSWIQGLQARSIAATAVVCLLIGGLAGYLFGDKRDDTWREFVATYQALYINTTLAHIDQSSEAASAELSRVSAILGKGIDLPSLTKQPGLDYKRAQILGFEGQPLLQMTFLSKVGAPIALCVMRSNGSGAKPVRLDTMQGMRSASWSKDGYEYLLIGGSDAGLIEQAAEQFAKLL